jgi:hypothetical protein
MKLTPLERAALDDAVTHRLAHLALCIWGRQGDTKDDPEYQALLSARQKLEAAQGKGTEK